MHVSIFRYIVFQDEAAGCTPNFAAVRHLQSIHVPSVEFGIQQYRDHYVTAAEVKHHKRVGFQRRRTPRSGYMTFQTLFHLHLKE